MSEHNYPLLDKGFIRLVEMLGDDMGVVNAARVSFGQEGKGDERDKKLIDYLMRNGHETPFEHALFKFHVKCPIFVARQWFRHRWASYNEISGRYTTFQEEFYVPEHFRVQVGKNYQYEDVTGEKNEQLRQVLQKTYDDLFALYQKFLADGVAKELARMILPVSTYTQFYWTVNARSVFNFLKLRNEEHAQYEIRVYADAIAKVMKDKMPWCYESFERHYLRPDVPPSL